MLDTEEKMTDTIVVVRPYLELLYFASGIAVAIAAVLALRQLSLAKQAVRIQSKRDALRLTSEQCEVYLGRIIPELNSTNETLDELGIKFFDDWDVGVEKGKAFAEKKNGTADIHELSTEAIKRLLALNAVEAFATYFTSKLADEKVAFAAVGKSYCTEMERYMPWILFCEKGGHYKNIVKLYVVWRSHLEAGNLEAELETMRERLEDLSSQQSDPVGTSID